MSNQLIEAQRYEIYLGLKRKWSRTRIAKEIGVSVSTVCREIKRNAKADGSYVWKQAQAKCDSRKHGFVTAASTVSRATTASRRSCGGASTA